MGTPKVGQPPLSPRPSARRPAAQPPAAEPPAAAAGVDAFVGARSGHQGASAAAARSRQAGDPRMVNPQGGTIKLLLTTTPTDHAVGAARATASLRSLLELTTRPAAGRPPAFEPRSLTGELKVFAATWDNPARALAVIFEFSTMISPGRQREFLSWMAAQHPEKHQAYAAEIAAIFAPGSPAQLRFASHQASPAAAVKGVAAVEAIVGQNQALRVAGQVHEAWVITGAAERRVFTNLGSMSDRRAMVLRHIAQGLQRLDVDAVYGLAQWAGAAVAAGKAGQRAVEEVAGVVFGTDVGRSTVRDRPVAEGHQLTAAIMPALAQEARQTLPVRPRPVRQQFSQGAQASRLLATQLGDLIGREQWFIALPYSLPGAAAARRGRLDNGGEPGA